MPDPILHRSNRATFGPRAGASIIDSIVFFVSLVVPGAVLYFLDGALPREGVQSCLDASTGQRVLCQPLTGGSVAVIASTVVSFAIAYLFLWSGELIGRRGVTPGRRLLRIRVVDIATAEPIGVWRGIGRYLIQIPLGLCFIGSLVDIFWMMRDADSQTIHDKVVGSVVVRDLP
jgi:uncharacterized RDD family membrane protein YckC